MYPLVEKLSSDSPSLIPFIFSLSPGLLISLLLFTCDISLSFYPLTSHSHSYSIFVSNFFFLPLQGLGIHCCCQNEWNGVWDGIMCRGILMSQHTHKHIAHTHTSTLFTPMHTTVCVIHLQISAKECNSPIQKTLHGCQLLAHSNYSIHILSLSISISTGQPAHYDTIRSLLLQQYAGYRTTYAYYSWRLPNGRFCAEVKDQLGECNSIKCSNNWHAIY